MPTTPIGMRTWPISRPFGRRHAAIVSPTGSGRSGDLLEPLRHRLDALGIQRQAVEERRRRRASGGSRRGRWLRAGSTQPFANAGRRDARPRSWRRCRPRRAGARRGARGDRSLGRSPRRRRRDSRDHHVVAMDHLVAELIAEDRIDVARVTSLDAAELGGAVVDQAASDLAAVGREAADASPAPNEPSTRRTPEGSRLRPRRPRGRTPSGRATSVSP